MSTSRRSTHHHVVRNVRLETSYDDLQVAVDHADAGDLLVVGPGLWGDSVIVTRPVTLLGKGGDPTVLAPRSGWPAVLALGAGRVVIEGMLVVLIGGSPLALAQATSVDVVGCQVRGDGTACLAELCPSSHLQLRRTTVRGASGVFLGRDALEVAG